MKNYARSLLERVCARVYDRNSLFSTASILGVAELKMPKTNSKKAEKEVSGLTRKRVPEFMEIIKKPLKIVPAAADWFLCCC
jgi:hypothetical protein